MIGGEIDSLLKNKIESYDININNEDINKIIEYYIYSGINITLESIYYY
jgi:hypothetical protein